MASPGVGCSDELRWQWVPFPFQTLQWWARWLRWVLLRPRSPIIQPWPGCDQWYRRYWNQPQVSPWGHGFPLSVEYDPWPCQWPAGVHRSPVVCWDSRRLPFSRLPQPFPPTSRQSWWWLGWLDWSSLSQTEPPARRLQPYERPSKLNRMIFRVPVRWPEHHRPLPAPHIPTLPAGCVAWFDEPDRHQPPVYWPEN